MGAGAGELLSSLPQLRVLRTNWNRRIHGGDAVECLTRGPLRTQLEELSAGSLPDLYTGELGEWGHGLLSMPRVHTFSRVPYTAQSVAGAAGAGWAPYTDASRLGFFPALRRLHGVWAGVLPPGWPAFLELLPLLRWSM